MAAYRWKILYLHVNDNLVLNISSVLSWITYYIFCIININGIKRPLSKGSWHPHVVMDTRKHRWVSSRVRTVILGKYRQGVKPLSPANPKSHWVQIVLIESVLWLTAHSLALLPPMDLTRPKVWSVGWCGSHLMQHTLPSWSDPTLFFPPISAQILACQNAALF